MFKVGLIDSLKLRVRLENVKVIDKRLTSGFVRYYYELADFDDDDNKADPLVRIINGITYRFYIKAFIAGNSKETKRAEEYVVFQISAKMCKKNYFDGITADNILNIVDDINALKIVEITPFNFLHGLVSDIDICINQLISMKDLSIALGFIRHFPQASKKPLMHFISRSNAANKLYNLGVDFNKREKATNSTPYCKIYHKGLELQSKSVDFYKAYLEPMKASILDNLVRFEFTIKNHKHKEYIKKKGLLKSEMKTLDDLLKIPQSELTDIAKSGLKYYLEPRSQPKSKNDGLTPTEIWLKEYIETLIVFGHDKDMLLQFLYRIECPVQRSQTKSRANKLIDGILNENKNLKTKITDNEEANKFLFNLGYR